MKTYKLSGEVEFNENEKTMEGLFNLSKKEIRDYIESVTKELRTSDTLLDLANYSMGKLLDSNNMKILASLAFKGLINLLDIELITGGGDEG